ncbi:MAG: T9SS type A sorting domain-containing protein [Bacteroidetes bacterium]|nr:T9SS type A sorting domain-containing protein [Bacteroidota bacterium]
MLNENQLVRNNYLNYLISDNDNLPDTSIYELNEKIVNDIYFNHIINNDLFYTPAQQTVLLNIASQCYLAGGIGVFMARSLYRSVSDTIFNDHEICSQSSVIKTVNTKPLIDTTNKIRFFLFPNPSSDFFTLSWDTEENEVAELVIMDALGKVKSRENVSLETKSIRISTNKLENGVYLLKVITSAGINNVGKLTVVK